MKSAAFVSSLLAAVALSSAADTCQDTKASIQDCDIKYHTCTHWDPEQKYQSDATDGDSGANEKGDWHSSSTTAAYDATQLLFDKDLDSHSYNDYDCNCQVQDIDQATCQIRVTVCFYFKDIDAVEDGDVIYKAHAYDAVNQDNSGSADGYSDPTDCGNAAAADLFAKYPDTAAKCGAGKFLPSSGFTFKAVAPEVKVSTPVDLPKNNHKFRGWPEVAGFGGSTCTGTGEFCCGAPGGDVNNCPKSAQTDDCTAKNDCCCG
jgi:hypothetical protein